MVNQGKTTREKSTWRNIWADFMRAEQKMGCNAQWRDLPELKGVTSLSSSEIRNEKKIGICKWFVFEMVENYPVKQVSNILSPFTIA